MKSYFLTSKNKAILSTIFIVFVLCSTATAIPYVHNSTNTKILQNHIDEKQKFKEQLFLDSFELIKNRFSNIQNSKIFNKFTDIFENNKLEFLKIFNDFLNNTSSIKSLSNIKYSNGQMFNESIINNIFEKNNLKNDDQYSGFESWWKLYRKCLILWSLGGILPYEDYDSWYSSVKTIQVVLIPIILVVYVSITLSAESASTLWMFLFIWELYLVYFNYTYLLSSNLLVREVDIVIELKDKETGLPIDGIEIYATNINATDQKGAGSEFTYLLEPFENMGPGYYSLASRDREYKYCQPPTPPGTYFIEIPEGQFTQSTTYEGYEYTTERDLMDAESYLFTIELESL